MVTYVFMEEGNFILFFICLIVLHCQKYFYVAMRITVLLVMLCVKDLLFIEAVNRNLL